MKNNKYKVIFIIVIYIVMAILSVEVNGVCLGDDLLVFLGIPAYINGLHVIVLCMIVTSVFIILTASKIFKLSMKSKGRKNVYVWVLIAAYLLFILFVMSNHPVKKI